MEVNDSQLIELVERLARRHGNLNAASDVRVTLVEPGLVRLDELARGGTSILMSKDGGVLQYFTPPIDDKAALASFRQGKRTEIPEPVKNELGLSAE